MRDYFLDLIGRARQKPSSGLLSHLLAAQAAGVTLDRKPISDRDILASLWGMYSAGTDTTGNSFASLFVMVADDPSLAAMVQERPEIGASVVEEALRLDPAFPTVTHETIREVTFGDVVAPPGTKVAAWISSANRDPAVFHDPGAMRLGRKPNPHLTFGNGLHLCLGAPLARIELREMLRVIASRLDELPGLRVADYTRRAGIVHRFTRLEFRYG
jgi:cytochrome P450